jgi:hypothetical protein
MKKNLIICVLAIAFITSFSWNWIGKAKARGDSVEDTANAVNTFVGNGNVFSGITGGGGSLQITFVSPPNQPAALMTVTITNIDQEDIGYVID